MEFKDVKECTGLKDISNDARSALSVHRSTHGVPKASMCMGVCKITAMEKNTVEVTGNPSLNIILFRQFLHWLVHPSETWISRKFSSNNFRPSCFADQMKSSDVLVRT